jgi:hypothetical protein
MTTGTISGRKVQMTITEKARLLSVFETSEPGKLTIPSGSDAHKAYVLSHDGHHVTHCPCDARTSQCCHTVAGNWFLEAKNRAAYVEEFGIYN